MGVKGIAVAALRAALNRTYRALRQSAEGGRRVLFLSRQSNAASPDYQALAAEFERRGFQVDMIIGLFNKREALSYGMRLFEEARKIGQASVVFLDGFDPVVSLLDLECVSLSPEEAELKGIRYTEFPARPVVIQLWHAFGAFKKFGFQTIGSREGRSSESADLVKMHRNYSWVICSGESCRAAFAEAFNYPVSRVVALSRPERDRLEALRETVESAPDAALPRILFAPTLRRNSASSHPFRQLKESESFAALASQAELLWTFHPLESEPGDIDLSKEVLASSDYVITDYSSVVYEAELLGKRIAFYVPDVDEYLESPGLNLNPVEVCPEISFRTEADLQEALRAWSSGDAAYPQKAMDAFMAGAFGPRSDQGAAADLADFAISQIQGTDRAN